MAFTCSERITNNLQNPIKFYARNSHQMEAQPEVQRYGRLRSRPARRTLWVDSEQADGQASEHRF